jgi:uncharacterized membrane-anchored protein YhcB (DUF1043 family)
MTKTPVPPMSRGEKWAAGLIGLVAGTVTGVLVAAALYALL